MSIGSSALLLLFLLGAEPNRPDYCGDGPVTIKVNQPVACPDTCGCDPPVRIEGSDIYRVASCWCQTIACFGVVAENWTDYPECGGERIAGLPDSGAGGGKG